MNKKKEKKDPASIAADAVKTILLVRHAKSSWDDPAMSDFDRPLNERGKKDAPSMAHRLKTEGWKIDGFYTSPAKRAKKTAIAFAKEFDVEKDKIHLEPDLYEPSVEAFYEVISKASDRFATIAVFAHNPGITDFANELTETRIDNIPTCGVFAIRVNSNKWADFNTAEKVFLSFTYPKEGDSGA